VTWRELIALAEQHGYQYAAQTPHPELADGDHIAALARALTAAAMEKRGGPLTEYHGVAVSDGEWVEWVRVGKVEV
jgi:hypothetical protein